MKVALVHYWLVGMRGGEKVLELLCEMYPDADIFTLVADTSVLSSRITDHRITTSFLQKIGGRKHYQKLLPLMPFALEAFDLTGYDLVISSEAGPAKGVITRPDALHICYCHSPMRYIWDLYPQYRAASGPITRAVMNVAAPILRQWDVTTSHRVDHFIANSNYVSKRILKYYRRDSTVIHPPVDLERFKPSEVIDDVYLCAGQITPYKKIEIAIDCFNQNGKRLDIVGSGASEKLKALAKPNIKFLGPLSDEEMALKFARSKALIFPGVEDFGILPLEVMASGRPVIAFARGGAVETVVEGKTGILFHEQSALGLSAAVSRFEGSEIAWKSEDFSDHVARFSKAIFMSKISEFISQKSADNFLNLTPQ